MHRLIALATVLGIGLGLPAQAGSQPVDTAETLTYADFADLAAAAPIAARARIRRAARLPEERAPGVAPGHVRYYVEADLQSLIRSPAPVPARVSYLVDVPANAGGRLRGREVLLLAAPVPGRSGELVLAAEDAQLDWSESREATIRAIVAEAVGDNAPGAVTGVGSAFSVPGALPGESETQIFLATSDGRPVSISVLRRPNQRPRWTVSLSEIVERASPPPAPNTLLWYRLACFMPDELPESSRESMDSGQSAIAEADYRLVMRDLGPCPRSRF